MNSAFYENLLERFRDSGLKKIRLARATGKSLPTAYARVSCVKELRNANLDFIEEMINLLGGRLIVEWPSKSQPCTIENSEKNQEVSV